MKSSSGSSLIPIRMKPIFLISWLATVIAAGQRLILYVIVLLINLRLWKMKSSRIFILSACALDFKTAFSSCHIFCAAFASRLSSTTVATNVEA